MSADLRELYQEVILDHGRSPRNFRLIEHPSAFAHGHNPMCGDALTVFLVVGDDDRIADVAFQGKGCAISVASASLMSEVVKGRRAADAERLFAAFQRMCTSDDFDLDAAAEDDRDALERLQALEGVRAFPIRVKCATLAWHTLHAALKGETGASTE
jgi:nitrogen fixation NifU-like protein